ncbi:1661_t:CDS:2 [Diversispora eburnea]|uniref:1661_t:CDS:1 n=1 Tax=Diversispora eburnea TaxID=1213867 RepID=A0A9N8Z6P7_9GLOM|nr:1661_t:CDS:2 [Diversispora eburnea]
MAIILSPKSKAPPFTIETRVILPENMKLKPLPIPGANYTQPSLEEDEDDEISDEESARKVPKNFRSPRSTILNAKKVKKISSKKSKINEEEEEIDLDDESEESEESCENNLINPRRIRLRANYKKFWDENILKPNFDMLENDFLRWCRGTKLTKFYNCLKDIHWKELIHLNHKQLKKLGVERLASRNVFLRGFKYARIALEEEMSKTSSDKYTEKYGLGELQKKLTRQREERYEQHHVKIDEYARERRMKQGDSNSNYMSSPSIMTLGIQNILKNRSKKGQNSEIDSKKKKFMIKPVKEKSIGQGRMGVRRVGRW